MSTAKQLYNFQQILPFNAGPVFPELAGKTVGELTDAQAVQAHEDWIRAQFGHMREYYQPHLAMLLHVIDGLRAQLLDSSQLLVRTTNELRRARRGVA